MVLYDQMDFMRLSATLNIQLTAEGVGWENIVRIITNRMPMKTAAEHDTLMHVLEYLDEAYAQRRRRTGPPAILHPLRATALLSQASEIPDLLDIFTELLHDKYEDLTADAMGAERFEQAERKFRGLLAEIDPTDEWYLMERLEHLTLRPGESYYQYIGRLLLRAGEIPALVRVKLSDRLDNTLDLHVDVDDLLKDADFFEVIFRILFPPSGAAYRSKIGHPVKSPLNGAQRLYQLFKNSILLSLIRERGAAEGDATARRLFGAVAMASMHEAQRIALHIMAYHESDLERQRAILMKVLHYAQEEGLTRITSPGSAHELDGFFLLRFDHPEAAVRDGHLNELYQDKGLMLQAAMGFVIIFMNFMHSPEYWIHGISDRGIAAAGI